jgi:hypothetical protein
MEPDYKVRSTFPQDGAIKELKVRGGKAVEGLQARLGGGDRTAFMHF